MTGRADAAAAGGDDLSLVTGEHFGDCVVLQPDRVGCRAGGETGFDANAGSAHVGARW